MKGLTLQQVLHIHDLNVQRFGGSPGVRDMALLESSLGQPFMSAFGTDLYPGLFEKAAAYWFFLARNHPFIDGNKRTALSTALIYLKMHGVNIQTGQALEDHAVETATGQHDVAALALQLKAWSV